MKMTSVKIHSKSLSFPKDVEIAPTIGIVTKPLRVDPHPQPENEGLLTSFDIELKTREIIARGIFANFFTSVVSL